MIPIHTIPSPRELRWFGVTFAAFFGVVGLIVWRYAGSLAAPAAIWITAAAGAAVYYVVPATRPAIYRGWLIATYPIAWLVTHVLLGIVYFGVVTPIGLGLRLIGRDALARRFDRDAATYWVRRDSPADPARYFRQF